MEIWRFVTDLHHPCSYIGRLPHPDPKRYPPDSLDGGLKDTVDIRPAETVEILTRFGNHRGRYVFHCHNLEHEDMGMMATFRTM